jgi:holo-[acyl-carrier protein] synthase
VDIERLRVVMQRSHGTERRLFTRSERDYCEGRGDPVLHYAGTLAAKEAVIKAAGLGTLAAWGRRIEVRRNSFGAPQVKVIGIDHSRFDLSISHDGSMAVAVAVVDRSTVGQKPAVSDEQATVFGKPKTNQQLLRYIRGPHHQRFHPVSALGDASSSVTGTDFP